MVCAQPRMYAVEVAVADHKDNVFGPMRVVCSRQYLYQKTRIGMAIYRRFKNAANDSTVDTPLKFSPPVRLFQEALMTIASVPDVLGAEKTA